MTLIYQRFQLDNPRYLHELGDPFENNPFGLLTLYRTYSRIKEDKKIKSQENWFDIVVRNINGVFSIRKDWYIKNHIEWDEKYWQAYAKRMAISMYKMEWMPPGRGLWLMGTDFIYEEGSAGLQNCGFTEIGDNIAEDICWAMDMLMLGVGVGFESIRNNAFKVYMPNGYFNYTIPDSREGWVESVRLLINAFIKPNQKEPRFNDSLVRPAGSSIKRFGGVSSGPEPLRILHDQIRYSFIRYFNWFKNKSNPTDYYDIIMLKTDLANYTGCCVVAGNLRRSAELAKGKITDQTFLNLKCYDNSRFAYREQLGWMSNNSVTLEEDSDFDLLGEISNRVIKNGEPGIINLRNFPYGRIGKQDKLRKDHGRGINPCQPYSALILTPKGIRQFGTLKEGDLIWSETGWTKVLKIWSNGIKPVYKYETAVGYFIGTEDHKIIQYGYKIPIKDASNIDILVGEHRKINEYDPQAIMDGLLIGDGGIQAKHPILFISEKDTDYFTSEISSLIKYKHNTDGSGYHVDTTLHEENLCHTYNRIIPDQYLYANRIKICSFLRGLYSANGSTSKAKVRLSSSSRKLIDQVQIMLSSIGIKSTIHVIKEHETEFYNGVYTCKESYSLNIFHDRWKFYESIGFIQKYKMETLKNDLDNLKINRNTKDTFEIISTKFIGEEEVFDITVSNFTHTFWAGGLNISNCGEQILCSKELCNLVDTLPTKCTSSEIWLQACEYAATYAHTVTLLPTHNQDTNKIMLANRRIGVGIMDFVGWRHKLGTYKITSLMRQGYKLIRKTVKRLSREAGIITPIRVTTIKPNGTTAKVAGIRSGAGYSNFEYMIRRIRVQQYSTFDLILRKANIPHEPDLFSANTEVFEYPWSLKDGTKTAEEVTVHEQAMNLILLQREWSDNAVSNTLMFKPKWKLKRVMNGHEDCMNYLNILEEIGITINLEMQPKEVKDNQTKLKFSYDTDGIVQEIKEYMFDPRHEEDDIEAVLSAIVPLIKTCTLSPHTPVGVYAQMPEEGITKEEYEKRKAAIKPIDWSKFLNTSNIEQDKYCNSESCEIVRKE